MRDMPAAHIHTITKDLEGLSTRAVLRLVISLIRSRPIAYYYSLNRGAREGFPADCTNKISLVEAILDDLERWQRGDGCPQSRLLSSPNSHENLSNPRFSSTPLPFNLLRRIVRNAANEDVGNSRRELDLALEMLVPDPDLKPKISSKLFSRKDVFGHLETFLCPVELLLYGIEEKD